MKSNNPYYPISSETRSHLVVSDIKKFIAHIRETFDDEVCKKLFDKIISIAEKTAFIEPEWCKENYLSSDFISVFRIYSYYQYRVGTIMVSVEKKNFAQDIKDKFPDIEYFCFEGKWFGKHELDKIEWIFF